MRSASTTRQPSCAASARNGTARDPASTAHLLPFAAPQALDAPATPLRSIGPQWCGSISAIDGARLSIAGLSGIARIGGRLTVERSAGGPLPAEIIRSEEQPSELQS